MTQNRFFLHLNNKHSFVTTLVKSFVITNTKFHPKNLFVHACDRSESGCSDERSSFHPGWPGCYSCHDGLHPRPLLLGRDFHDLAECRHRLRRTRALPSVWYMANLDTSLKMQCLHWRKFQTLCLWSHSLRRRLSTKVSLGRLAGRRARYSAARSRFITVTVRAVMCLPKLRIICIFRRGAEMKWFILTTRRKWCKHLLSTSKLPLIWSPLFLIVPQEFTSAFLHHAPRILATSHCEVPCIDNKTICQKPCSSEFRDMMSPMTHGNRNNIIFKTQFVISRQLALRFSPKITTPELFFFERASTVNTQTRSTTKSVK